MPAGEFETGSLTLALMQSDAFGQEFQAHRAPVALHVDDYEGAKRELSSRGIELENEIDSGVCNMEHSSATADGNSLMIRSPLEADAGRVPLLARQRAAGLEGEPEPEGDRDDHRS